MNRPSLSPTKPPRKAMAERYEGDPAVANGFGRRYLHEWEACTLYEAGYMAPLDSPNVWMLSVGYVPIPPERLGVARVAVIH
jgi:hypothetical protein